MKKKEDWFTVSANELSKVKYRCRCGHKVIIPKWVDKQLCDWCGNYVFKSKKDEFEYRMKERLGYARRGNSTI